VEKGNKGFKYVLFFKKERVVCVLYTVPIYEKIKSVQNPNEK